MRLVSTPYAWPLSYLATTGVSKSLAALHCEILFFVKPQKSSGNNFPVSRLSSPSCKTCSSFQIIWYVPSHSIAVVEIFYDELKNIWTIQFLSTVTDYNQSLELLWALLTPGFAEYKHDLRQLLTGFSVGTLILSAWNYAYSRWRSLRKGMSMLRIAWTFPPLFRDDYTTRKAFLILNYHVESVSTSFSLVWSTILFFSAIKHNMRFDTDKYHLQVILTSSHLLLSFDLRFPMKKFWTNGRTDCTLLFSSIKARLYKPCGWAGVVILVEKSSADHCLLPLGLQHCDTRHERYWPRLSR